MKRLLRWFTSRKAVMLYSWQPKGHGQYSFFVASTSKMKAIKAVEQEIRENEDVGAYEIKGWLTDYYRLTVLPINTAIYNAND